MNIFIIISILLYSIMSYDYNYDSYEKNNSLDTLLYPSSKHREQSKLIYQLLTKYHYKKIEVNDSLSEKILDKYISSLDPNREYFFSSDINYFNQYKKQMDDYVVSGYLEPAYEIFTVYHQRVKDRISYVFKLLENEPDFSIEESLLFDRKELDWFTDAQSMDDYWRKKIKNAILNLKVLGKDWDSNKETMNKRYKRFEKTIS